MSTLMRLSKKEIENLCLSGYAASDEIEIIWLDNIREDGKCIYRVNNGKFAINGDVLVNGSLKDGGDIIESFNHSDDEMFDFEVDNEQP